MVAKADGNGKVVLRKKHDIKGIQSKSTDPNLKILTSQRKSQNLSPIQSPHPTVSIPTLIRTTALTATARDPALQATAIPATVAEFAHTPLAFLLPLFLSCLCFGVHFLRLGSGVGVLHLPLISPSSVPFCFCTCDDRETGGRRGGAASLSADSYQRNHL